MAGFTRHQQDSLSVNTPSDLGKDTARFTKVIVPNDVNVLDLMAAFPSFRRIFFPTCSLRDLLLERFEINDEFLRSVATRGIWDLGLMPGKKLTDEGILDFAFGDYADDGKGRKANIESVTLLSPQFITKIVKVRYR